MDSCAKGYRTIPHEMRIENLIRAEYDKPRHNEMAGVGSSYGPISRPTFVKSLLTNVGSIEFEMNTHNRKVSASKQIGPGMFCGP
jgi:hypothetical protein